MVIKYSSSFATKLERLKKKNSRLAGKVGDKLRILMVNPRHPSLRLHKISGKYEAWSISVDMSLRVLFVYTEYGILLVDIGTHEEVY